MKLGLDTKYLKTVLAYFLTACAALLLIFYFCYHLFNGFTADVQTQLATAARENDRITAQGYLLRDETVIRSARSGVVDYAVADGERVGKDALLAQVYAATDDGSVRRRVMAIDEELALLEASAIGEGVVVSDTSATDAQIDSMLYAIRSSLMEGRYDYARRETDGLLIQLNKRRLITKQVQNYNDRIAALNAERASLTARLAGGAQQLRAAESGYFFYGIDGYEQIFAADPASLTLTDFDAMRQASPAAENAAVGKLVDGYRWYLVVPVEKKELEPFTEGDSYAVTFPYNYDITLTMTLERMVTELERDDALLIFSTGTMPEGFSYLRVQNVEITTRIRQGLRVPSEAIRVVEELTCVYIVRGGLVELRRVEILMERDGDCIVAIKEDPPAPETTAPETTVPGETTAEERKWPPPYLALYDEVIVSGKALYDGKVLT